MKEFSNWTPIKQTTHAKSQLPLYATREVWWAILGLNIGSEQDGQGDNYKRPVLVLRGLSKEVCIVVPLTTSTKRDKFYIDAGMVGGKAAAAIISQIRLVDTRRLVEKVQTLPVDAFERIRNATKDLL